MKRLLFACCLGLLPLALGCAETDPSEGTGTPAATAQAAEPAAASTDPATAPASEESSGKKIELTPKNTSIEFTGLHTGEKPDPRHGSFQKFSGTAMVDGSLKSVEVDIQTASLTTDKEKLTTHLKSPDFFDVNRFPKASFHSTSIEQADEGKVNITGDLTLMETTNSITFPATVSTEGELTLSAELKIDRTKWGMNYGVDNVEKEVSLKITIGG